VTAVELLTAADAVPSNPEWHSLRRAGISASEIAAVCGISPWESPFSLYWRKVNDWQVDETEEMVTGRRVEPVIADWWAETYGVAEPVVIRRAGLYASEIRPWQLATPDRLVHQPCGCLNWGSVDPRCWNCHGVGADVLLAVLECKWTGRWDGWGEPGTDDIPVYYRAQVLWQMDVLGVDLAHVAVLGPGGFRAYRVHRDKRDLRVLRGQAALFVAQRGANAPPDIDSHAATAAALRQLHPSVEDFDVEVPVELAEGYRRARALRARIEQRVDTYENRIRAAIGTGRRAMCGGRLVASRSVYDQSGDTAELTALEGDWPTVNRLNPGRSKSYV
jgi:putative phage-type endonuclease